MDKKIRPLTFDDEDEIIDLIKVSLYNGDQLHIGELLPTESNVYNFYRFEIFPLIIDEEPLLGYFNDKLIGIASCTTRFNKMYNLKKSLALGMITITHPDHRRPNHPLPPCPHHRHPCRPQRVVQQQGGPDLPSPDRAARHAG